MTLVGGPVSWRPVIHHITAAWVVLSCEGILEIRKLILHACQLVTLKLFSYL